MPQSPDLEQVITGCKHGDPESFSQLVDLYAKRCYGYFYRMTGNRTVSEDLLSELFMRVVEKINTFRTGSFDAWIFRVASNIFQDHLRAGYRRVKALKEHETRLADQPAVATDNPHEQDEKLEQLQLCLAELDLDTRQTLMLRFYSQLSFKEIARLRREPIGTTLSRGHRGLKKLRDLMGA